MLICCASLRPPRLPTAFGFRTLVLCREDGSGRPWATAATRSGRRRRASNGQLKELLYQVAVLGPALDECGRRAGHAGPDAADEVALDPLPDGVRAAVGVEALQIEPEAPGALPEVRIVHPPPVAVERVAHLPE